MFYGFQHISSYFKEIRIPCCTIQVHGTFNQLCKTNWPQLLKQRPATGKQCVQSAQFVLKILKLTPVSHPLSLYGIRNYNLVQILSLSMEGSCFWISYEKYFPVLATVTAFVNLRLSHIMTYLKEQGVREANCQNELSKYSNYRL